MDKQQIYSFVIYVVCSTALCSGQYTIPNVMIEAFTPQGLRVSFPADPGVELFAFHGKVNKPINPVQPGEINQDITRPTNGRFVYIDPAIKLKEGDEINYWIYVQHNQLGFRKDEQTWKVDKLLPQELLSRQTTQGCAVVSKSDVEGRKTVCPGESIINYIFSRKPIDTNVWLVEEYIPNEPDWEFNIYQNSPETVDIENNVLHIKPKFVEQNARRQIDVTERCTRKGKECKKDFEGPVWNPPIVSGKLQSKLSFSFGNITVKAKLPIGDFLYPKIYLEDVNNPAHRIIIAYARGNIDYIQGDVDDGAKKLFGGPYKSVKEKDGKSKYLSTYYSNAAPIGEDFHTFTTIWAPDRIDLYIDNTHFGEINASAVRENGFHQKLPVRLILGLGAGGGYEFPDGYTTAGKVKPYKSNTVKGIRQFMENKDSWLNTWNEDSHLQIEYVSVTAL